VSSIDVLVVGAGVTGLASALAVAELGHSVAIVERHPRAGLDTSTRNSGVIHAGIYYPAASLKAALCVTGRRLLYDFCQRHDVAYRRCGKLIVATAPQEIPALETLYSRGIGNGVEGLQMIDGDEVALREPAIRAVAAIYSPETGVVDQEGLVSALLRRCTNAGAIFLPGTRLLGARSDGHGLAVTTGRETIHARQVVNAAGLYADEVSTILGGETFAIHPCRGEYVELVRSRRSLVNGLVYPLPYGHGLGIHLIPDVGGGLRLGPTARYQHAKDDYESNRLPVEAFVEPARRLLRDITVQDLRPSNSGIRAKLHPAEESFADFLIRRDRVNPAVVQAAGIDSPGLTSCLAIGRLTANLVAEAA